MIVGRGGEESIDNESMKAHEVPGVLLNRHQDIFPSEGTSLEVESSGRRAR